MPNVTTLLTISNFYKMHLILGDNGCWVKAYITPLPPLLPPTIGKGSTNETTTGAIGDMTVA